jgi:CRP-like cAMP-binding protein/flavin-dependent dehydrogenase
MFAKNQSKKSQFHTDDNSGLSLENGSRIAVVGGGPAGSFFSYFIMQLAKRIDLELCVDIYERKDFSAFGAAGCNMCAGVISESLIQALSIEGIELPPDVVQRGVNSFVLHTSSDTAVMHAPFKEMRIATVYRGGGPRGASNVTWKSFDNYLLELAKSHGAQIISEKVTDLSWSNDKPQLHTAKGRQEYDLVVGAFGVNSPVGELFEKLGFGYKRPGGKKTYNCELDLGADFVSNTLGSAMHAFLLNLPNMDFGALVPKGNYATLCLIGKKIDTQFVTYFKELQTVRNLIKKGDGAVAPASCQCSPLCSLGAAKQPYGDRFVFIGDCGMSRLNKDGIGSAYRTAKAAAVTAVFSGVSAQDFRERYWPLCSAIRIDNFFGKLLYIFVDLVKKADFLTRGVMRTTKLEQGKENSKRYMSMILWDMFTGSAPYRAVFLRSLHPGFIASFLWNTLLALNRKAKIEVTPYHTEDIEEPSMERTDLGKVYNDGEIIFRQGEKGNCMYVIQSGDAEVVQTGHDNKEIRLTVLSKGDVFGEMAIFQEEVRSATVRALGKVRVIVVDKRIFLKRVHEDPSFAFTLLQKMTMRIKQLNTTMKERRRLERSTLTLPALIGEADAAPDNYEPGTAIDISISGIRFLVPKGTTLGGKEHEESTKFTVVFTLPDQQQPIEVKCRSKYLRTTEEGVEIGAKFVDPEAQIYQPLRQYLNNH